MLGDRPQLIGSDMAGGGGAIGDAIGRSSAAGGFLLGRVREMDCPAEELSELVLGSCPALDARESLFSGQGLSCVNPRGEVRSKYP